MLRPARIALAFNRDAVLALIGAAALAYVLAIDFVMSIARHEDRKSLAQTTQFVELLIGEKQLWLGRTLVDYTDWGAAYTHLHLTVDKVWAFDQDNFGRSLVRDHSIEYASVFNPAGNEVFSVVDGVLAGGPTLSRIQGVKRIVDEARRAKPREVVSGVVEVGGMPVLIAAGVLSIGTDISVTATDGPPSVVLFGNELDQSELAELRGKLSLDRLAMRAVPQPTSQPLFLRTTDGSKGFVLDVSAPRPGMLMMNAVLPSVIVVGGIFIVFLLLVARHGRQIAGSVEQAAEAMSEQNRELERSARYDPLTGLANRGLFTSYLEVALHSAKSPVAVFFLDLDHFKPINDKFGHEAGDFVLREVGRRLHDADPHVDICARLGGDEFVVVATVVDEASLHRLCRKLIGDISAEIFYGGESLQVGASVGVAVSRAGDALPDVLRRADKALYQAKNAGRGVYRIHSALDSADDPLLRVAG